MSRKINLEYLAIENFKGTDYPYSFRNLNQDLQRAILHTMREVCKELLELAAENAEIKQEWFSTGDYSGFKTSVIDKQSILDTINNVE